MQKEFLEVKTLYRNSEEYIGKTVKIGDGLGHLEYRRVLVLWK